jgi:proton-dependent oligopeptide transporter, POT family
MSPTDSRDAPLPLQPDVVDMPDVVEADDHSPGPGVGLLRSCFNHPKGLYALFFTEMWERFSFYLMLNLLALYLSEYLAFGRERSSDVATWYMSLVYFTPFIGGFIADRFTGYVRAVLAGGMLMMGHVLLAFDTKGAAGHPFLYAALGLLICGNGLFKPNISTMVGRLYSAGDPRRDQGFTIFYMGINVGAMLGPLTAGRLRKYGPEWAHHYLGLNLPADSGWHIAFASAGVGMLLSLLIFSFFRNRLTIAKEETSEADKFAHSLSGEVDEAGDGVIRFGQRFNMGLVTFFLAWLLLGSSVPWPESIKPIGLWPTQVINFGVIWLAIEAVTVLIFLRGGTLQCANAAKLKAVFVVVALFWMAFHQNSVSLLFFAADHTENVGSKPGQWSPEDFGAINAVFILVFSPLMMILWNGLARRGREPSSVSKMIMAMFITGLAYVVMVGAGQAGGDTGRVSPFWLVGCYALLTVAELWLSPIGLSLTSKLAPVKYRGLWMGFWFLATAVGNKLVHVTGQYVEKYPPSKVFLILVVSSVGAAFALDYILINLRRFGPPSTEA